jgi:hypothetical protein
MREGRRAARPWRPNMKKRRTEKCECLAVDDGLRNAAPNYGLQRQRLWWPWCWFGVCMKVYKDLACGDLDGSIGSGKRARIVQQHRRESVIKEREVRRHPHGRSLHNKARVESDSVSRHSASSGGTTGILSSTGEGATQRGRLPEIERLCSGHSQSACVHY